MIKVEIAFWQIHTDYAVDNEVKFRDELRMIDLNQWIISLTLKIFVPFVKLLCKMDFFGPVSNQIQVFETKPAGLRFRSYNEVVKTSLEEPLGLLFLEYDSAFLDFIELDHVAW